MGWNIWLGSLLKLIAGNVSRKSQAVASKEPAMETEEPMLAKPSPHHILSYRPRNGIYDEMMDGDGAIRAAWRTWHDSFSKWSVKDIQNQVERLNTLVRDNGIAYDLFADPANTEQPWFIDVAPLIISAQDWSWLSSALSQRARLFNALFLDLYGEQRVITEGLVPAQLIFSDSTFLHPLRNADFNQDALQFYAADIGRGADGRWRVLDNHAETPAGIGFALANRIALTHCEGNLFRKSNALRLASYFQRLQETLIRRSGIDNPQIAVLSPGPEHSDYFSHSYIAKYLGYLLVEGADLVVLDGQIKLKTLGGLKPINGLIRSIEGAKCDPLELDPDGFQGTAGMVQATRQNARQICNAPGTAIVENRGLAAYLAEICQFLLGEELMLREATRWWLGDHEARSHVFANLDQMVITHAHEGSARPGQVREAIDGAGLSAKQRRNLENHIALHGATMIAEAKSDCSTTPSWTGERLEPRHQAFRAFLSRYDNDYDVMPGGLAMTMSPCATVGLRSPEGLTRDVWVISEQKTGSFESLWRLQEQPVGIIRTGRSLQSRIADNLYWLGRNVERAEWTMRVCRQALSRLEEDSGPEEDAETVIEALSILLDKDPDKLVMESGFGSDGKIERMVRTLIFATDRNYGFQSHLSHVHRLAVLTRDRLSSDAWNILNTFFTRPKWRRDPRFSQTSQMIDMLNEGITMLAAFSGMVMENMTRSYSWRFLDMGRRIQRAGDIAELIARLVENIEDVQGENNRRLMFVLELADSFITYRSRYRIMPSLPAVVDLLLLDETNPRALAFQLVALSEHINHLPMQPGVGLRSEEARLILELLSRLQLSDSQMLTHEVGKPTSKATNTPLKDLLNHQIERLPLFTDIITRRFFTLTDDQPTRL